MWSDHNILITVNKSNHIMANYESSSNIGSLLENSKSYQIVVEPEVYSPYEEEEEEVGEVVVVVVVT